MVMILSRRVFLASSLTAWAASTKEAERWDATIAFGDLKLPFSMRLQLDGTIAKATFTNLGEPTGSGDSAQGRVGPDGLLKLSFANGGLLDAKLDGGSIKGFYSISNSRYAVDGGKFCTCGFVGEAGPDVAGSWSTDNGGKLVLERKGEETIGVLTMSGVTTAPLAGRFDGAVFTLAYFNGDPSRAAWLEMEPSKDLRTLTLVYRTPGAKAMQLKASKT